MAAAKKQQMLSFSARWLLTTLFATAFSLSLEASVRPKVAVIGGGVAGLSCANRLASAGSFDVTVFDTGRLRPGGRSSSRLPGDRAKDEDPSYRYLSKCIMDHAAQVLSVPNSPVFQEFAKQVEEWESCGVLKQFPTGSLHNIQSKDENGFQAEELPSDSAYYGSGGMSSIPLAMVDKNLFDLKQDVWVSPSNGVRYMNKTKQWKVQAKGKVLGYYDKLIIAHNGKCADRLMSKTPAKRVHSLLRVNFAPTVPAHGGKHMTLNSIYSLTVALPKDSPLSRALPDPFITGFVQNERNLRCLSCQTRKYPPYGDSVEVWTILSSSSFAKKHKGPQEFLPEETVEEVTRLLLQSVERCLNLKKNSLEILESRLQLWGAALPLNIWDNGLGYIYDSEYAVGVCGDWIVEPSIGGAWTSGHLLADCLISGNDETKGLKGSFQRSESASKLGIGALDLKSKIAQAKA